MTSTIKVTSHNYPVIVDTIDSGIATDSVTLKPEDGERTFYTTTTRELRITDLEMDGKDNRKGARQSLLNFSEALIALKAGKRVARAGWNGKGMFLFLVAGSTFKVNRPPLLGIYEEGTEINYHAHIDMKTADGQVVPWLASQTDVLADDWMVLGEV